MEYTVKSGVLGKLLDALMIRKQSDAGIKKFFVGLKSYTETRWITDSIPTLYQIDPEQVINSLLKENIYRLIETSYHY